MVELGDGEKSHTIKRYNLFDVIYSEEKKLEKSKGYAGIIKESENPESKYNLSSIESIQGMAGFNESLCILGSITSNQSESINVLIVYFQGKVQAVLKAHQTNYGIWGLDLKGVNFVITAGGDSETTKKGMGKDPSMPVPVCLKIWEQERLMAKEYLLMEEQGKVRTEEKEQPKIIPLDRSISLSSVSVISIARDLSMIAIGLHNGSILIIQAGGNKLTNLFMCTEKDYEYITLDSEPGLDFPITNIYITKEDIFNRSNYNDGDKIGYVFCTCEKVFYYRIFGPGRKTKTIFINNEARILSNGMDGIRENIVILDSKAVELLKYKGTDIVKSFKLSEIGVKILLTLENANGE